ncbi:MAG: hypothetical protein ACR2PI_20445 [Hyphomicrobiaceae bacterium]
MPSKSPPRVTQPYSANDNGPLSPGQVKALKIAIATMGVMIVAALLAIVGRVIYLSSIKKVAAPEAATKTALAPRHQVALPSGAVVKTMSLQGSRLLVHYQTPSGPGAIILDLGSGKTLSRVEMSTITQAKR